MSISAKTANGVTWGHHILVLIPVSLNTLWCQATPLVLLVVFRKARRQDLQEVSGITKIYKSNHIQLILMIAPPYGIPKWTAVLNQGFWVVLFHFIIRGKGLKGIWTNALPGQDLTCPWMLDEIHLKSYEGILGLIRMRPRPAKPLPASESDFSTCAAHQASWNYILPPQERLSFTPERSC